MILLRAVKAIPNAVAQIHAGTTFYEPDPEKESYWIKEGFAEAVQDSRTVLRPDVNARGWNGLMWDSATVCILASGPSLTEEQCAAVANWRDGPGRRRVIAINTTFQRAPWADVLYACDGRWWDMYFAEVKEKFLSLSGLWTQDVAAEKKYGIHLIRSERLPGLGKKPGIINQGASSGYQALNLAWQAGATKVILLGYDAREVNKQAHWHGDHPPEIKSGSPYAQWIKNFVQLAEDLKQSGCKVINATPGSAISAFPRATLDEALA